MPSQPPTSPAWPNRAEECCWWWPPRSAADRSGPSCCLGPRHGRHDAGRYAGFPQAGCWIGLDHDRWLRFGTSPLWLSFKDNSWGRAWEVEPVLRGVPSLEKRVVHEPESGNTLLPLVLKV